MYVAAQSKEPVIIPIAGVCPNAVSRYPGLVDDINDALYRVE